MQWGTWFLLCITFYCCSQCKYVCTEVSRFLHPQATTSSGLVWSLFCFRAMPRNVRILVLVLHSEITLGGAQGTIRKPGHWTRVSCVQAKCNLSSLSLCLDFNIYTVYVELHQSTHFHACSGETFSTPSSVSYSIHL